MDWNESSLDNGVRIISHHSPDYHSFSVGVWVRIGSRFEDERYGGISHFIEHLLFKGTRRRTYRRIKEEIEGVGGTFNGFTSEECTAYWVKILKEYLPRSLDVLADMVRNPRLDAGDIEKERTVICEEIRMYRDMPSHYVHELFDATLFGSHPLGRPIAGTEETLSAINRTTMEEFLHRHYTPENIVVSIAGNFPPEKLLPAVEDSFGTMRKQQVNTCPPWKRGKSGPDITLLDKKTEQTHFCLGGRAYSRLDPGRYPLTILNLILGGNMSSRLFNEVREKRGLAYDIRSYVKAFQDTGAFVISAGVAPDKTGETLKVVVEQLKKIRESGVRDPEIVRAKRFLVSQLLMSMEENTDYMMWIGEQRLLRNDLVTLQKTIEAVRSVTGDDIKKAAGDILRPSNLFLSLIGPGQDAAKLRSILANL